MLERLFKYLYRALDHDPHAVVALRVNHPDGFAWRVAGRHLTATTELGATLGSIDLRTVTIFALGTWLEVRSCTLVYSNSDVANRRADALLNGASVQSASNGDHLRVFDTLLWSVIDSYARELDDTAGDVVEALKQAYMTLAEADWLDYWGSFFGVSRDIDEIDSVYGPRIIEEVKRARNNALAIEKTVYDLTGVNVTLREPWREIFTLNYSALSGNDHFQDGNFYTWNVFQPIFRESVSPEMYARVMEIINRDRPIGTLPVHPGAQPSAFFGEYSATWSASFSGSMKHESAQTYFLPGVLSSSLILSDSYPEVPVMFKVTHYGITRVYWLATMGIFDAPLTWEARTWGSTTWNRRTVPITITQS